MGTALTVSTDTLDELQSSTLPTRECVNNGDRAYRRHRERLWYAHMVLIHLSEFGAEASRGLVLPTLFTYVQELGGGMEDIGLLTALFSVGRFFSSLLFGWLCDRTSFKVLYNVAGSCAVLGNLLYVLPYSPSVHSRTMLAFSRFVVGFGAGNRSVCRANIAMLTRVDQRLQYFTIFATVVFLAYALTPGLGSVVGDTQVQVVGDLLQFNRFTAPGFLLVTFNLITIGFNNFIFDSSISREDAPEAVVSRPLSAATKVPEKALAISMDGSTAHDTEVNANSNSTDCQNEAEAPILTDRAVTVGMLVFIFLNFNARGILSIFETVNVPLFLDLTNRSTAEEQDSVEATQGASSFYLVVGLLGLISYASVQLLRKKVPDVAFLLFGFAMLLVGNAILLTLCADMHTNNSSIHSANEVHSQQQFDIFVAAEVFVWSIGCPLTSAVVVSAFSKVLGSRPQGLLMGIFGSSASVARMVLPFLPSILASWPLLFLVNMVLCAICILVLSLYLGFISNQDRKNAPSNSSKTYCSVQQQEGDNLMELKVEPVCGRNYAIQEAGGAIVRKSFHGCSLPPSRGICWNPLTRSLMVCDIVKCCIHAFGASLLSDEKGGVRMSLNCDENGEYVATIGSRGSSPGQFLHPVAVAVNVRGEIAVADGKLNRVQIFSGGGDLIHVFGRTGTARGEFRGMSDVKFLPRGCVAIVDTGNDRIQVMTTTGIVVQVVGRYGWKLGEFANPCALAVNGSGDMFVCDEGNKRIQRFSAQGKPLVEWGSRRGPTPDTSTMTEADQMDFSDLKPAIYSIFDTPCDLVIGLQGEVLVCDSGRQQLFVFSDVGTSLHVINAPYIFKLTAPTATTICLNMVVTIGRSLQTKKCRMDADTQEPKSTDCLLAAFPPVKRVRMGHFEPVSAHCAITITSYLSYADVVYLRLVSRYFHHICRRLRNQWKLFPLTAGHATIMRYNRIVSHATGLVAAEEAFEKWGLRIFKPSNNIRKHVMDFEAGFSSALSSLYGPLFCYQHEEILRSLFRFYARATNASPTSAAEKLEIDKTAFIEIVTQIEEVRLGFRTWKQCAPFARSVKRPQSAVLPAIRATENMSASSGGVPLPKPLRLVENAQQHQLSKLLQKLQAL